MGAILPEACDLVSLIGVLHENFVRRDWYRSLLGDWAAAQQRRTKLANEETSLRRYLMGIQSAFLNSA
jgi:hypothetical protein